MTKEQKHPKVVLGAIAGLVIIEVAALFNGVNGTLSRIITVAIAGLAGWSIPFPRTK